MSNREPRYMISTLKSDISGFQKGILCEKRLAAVEVTDQFLPRNKPKS